jgi:hypothetical protein
MKRMLCCAALLAALVSCQVAPESRTAPLTPLPEKVTAVPYGRLLERARTQTKQATEAFYVDNWSDLEDAARGLEQTAQYLVKAEDVPAKHKDTLATMSGDLGKLAKSLGEAAKKKDVKETTDVLTKIQVAVREMRLGEGS